MSVYQQVREEYRRHLEDFTSIQVFATNNVSELVHQSASGAERDEVAYDIITAQAT